MTIKEGDKLPNAKLFMMKEGKPTPVTTSDLFAGKNDYAAADAGGADSRPDSRASPGRLRWVVS